jgi:hypothetical protein
MEIASLKSTIKKAKDGTYQFVMNEETTDRDGEIIEVDGWELKDYKDNSILLFGHRHDIPGIGTVGRVAKETNDGKRQLVAKGVRFATQGIYDLADVVHGLVDDDIIKAVSVGFQALEREYPTETGKGTGKDKAPRVRTKKASLYELSIVNVGAHPAALRIKSAVDKAAMDYKDKDMKEIEEKLFLDKEAEIKTEDFEMWLESEKVFEYADEKPYPNEHACRLLEPVDGAPTRRKNGAQEHEGKKYDVIYQKQKDGKWAQQAYRYPKGTWKVAAARSHCSAHDGKFEAASEGSIENINDAVIKKMDLLCLKIEALEEMIKSSKPRRLYDGLFDGDPKDQTKPPEKEDDIVGNLPKADPIQFLEDNQNVD